MKSSLPGEAKCNQWGKVGSWGGLTEKQMKLAPASSKALGRELALELIWLLVFVKISRVWCFNGSWLRSLSLSSPPRWPSHFFLCGGWWSSYGDFEIQLQGSWVGHTFNLGLVGYIDQFSLYLSSWLAVLVQTPRNTPITWCRLS